MRSPSAPCGLDPLRLHFDCPPKRVRAITGFSLGVLVALDIEACLSATFRSMLAELQHALLQWLPGQMFGHQVGPVVRT